MRNLYKTSFLLALLITIGSFVFAQSDEDTGECNVYIQRAMESIQSQCDELGNNQACFGKNNITAWDHSGQVFENFGPELDNRYIDLLKVQSMDLEGLDDERDVWGISLLDILTNTPITGTAREVKLILFGGVELKNASNTVITLKGKTNSDDVILRTGPSDQNGALTFLDSDTELELVGRLASGAWLRAKVVETQKVGWIHSNFVELTNSLSEDISDLQIMSSTAPYYSSMQAFTFSSGINTVGCSDMPTNGLLMQTPEGVAEVTMSMNGVSINLRGTAFAQAQKDGDMTISLLSGRGSITSGGQTVPIYAGTEVTISLDGLIGVGGPSNPKPMDDNLLDLPGELTNDIVISNPLDQDTIDILINPPEPEEDTVVGPTTDGTITVVTTTDGTTTVVTTTITNDDGTVTVVTEETGNDGQENCDIQSDGICGPKPKDPKEEKTKP